MENGVVLALVVEDLGGVLLCLFVVGAVAVVKAAVLCRVEGIELVKVDLCGLAFGCQLLVVGDDLSGCLLYTSPPRHRCPPPHGVASRKLPSRHLRTIQGTARS